MNVTVLDDYQDVVRTFPSFARMARHEVTIYNDHVQDTESLAERLKNTDALLLIRERTAIGRELLQLLPRLRFISQSGAIPHIDLQACAEHGVTVCSRVAAVRPSYATAELAWALVLAAWRRIPQEAAHLRSGGWQSTHAVGTTLRGRTLGIYGYGRIGAVVAGYGRAFGMRVMAYGRQGSLARAAADGMVLATSERQLFADSDVLSLHMALTDTTRGMVRREHLALMKPTGLIVNTSRARLIEEGALIEALRLGNPGLAAVDVFEEEPLIGASDPLLSLPNVLATPHLGYVERESLEFMFDMIFEQVEAFERGTPVNVVEPH